jgi:hypothetical protein
MRRTYRDELADQRRRGGALGGGHADLSRQVACRSCELDTAEMDDTLTGGGLMIGTRCMLVGCPTAMRIVDRPAG